MSNKMNIDYHQTSAEVLASTEITLKKDEAQPGLLVYPGRSAI